MEIFPVDDGTHSAPFTFMELTTLNFVRGNIGDVVWLVLEYGMELFR